MALVAILADDFSVAAYVLAVVAAEAANEVVMAQIVRMRLPTYLHFGEARVAVYLLNICNGIADFELLRLGNIWILAFVKLM